MAKGPVEGRPLSYQSLTEALERRPLFDKKTWRLSPSPWLLSAGELSEIEKIGKACLEFYTALELLYTRSHEGRNLLRNRELRAPWVADYLDRGKPRELVEHALSRRSRGKMPLVLRPDLLLTEDGFALTEMDSVPGGIGLTAYLNDLYEEAGFPVVGSVADMVSSFYAGLAAMAPHKDYPLIAILVSDEADTYRPEMAWLAETLQRLGKRVYCYHPSEVMPLGNTLCVDRDGNPEQIDVVYRFWELFDLGNVPVAEYILDAWEESEVEVSPPMRPFQEEKLGMALFHHPRLEPFWRENLSKASFRLLKKVIPASWILDGAEIPPNAVLNAPLVGGQPIWDWNQLGEASQRERNYILKLSGYHERAWGARSVLLGSDISRDEWKEGIRVALEDSAINPHILQEYRKPVRRRHPVYRDEKTVYEMEGRVRLCPYYFISGTEAKLAGVLSTFCPADKKIIHGMRDAAMIPSMVAG